jgi:hypothetical protein
MPPHLFVGSIGFIFSFAFFLRHYIIVSFVNLVEFVNELHILGCSFDKYKRLDAVEYCTHWCITFSTACETIPQECITFPTACKTIAQGCITFSTACKTITQGCIMFSTVCKTFTQECITFSTACKTITQVCIMFSTAWRAVRRSNPVFTVSLDCFGVPPRNDVLFLFIILFTI